MAATIHQIGALRAERIFAYQADTARHLLCAISSRRAYSRQAKPRRLHSSAAAQSTSIPIPISSARHYAPASRPDSSASPLSELPLSQILRTFLITSVSSSPGLLAASTALLRRMLMSKNPLWSLEKNPIMRAILWQTFYKQFCAGATKQQVSQTCQELREQGYAGVILEYALEVLRDEGKQTAAQIAADVAAWRRGMLASVEMAQSGDFVGLKWSGLGAAAMNRMKDELPPSEAMEEAMHAVCQSAAKKNISLLPAAEETWNLNGFHDWTLKMQRVYNLSGKSVVYTTYQAYLKQMPATVATHLALAKKEGFTLGAKLVRGAYLATEKRDLIWPSIEATHHAYDSLAEALIRREYTGFLRPESDKATVFPEINVVLATHNAATVERAQDLRRSQVSKGESLTPLVFAQLQGMADEVSCSLLHATKAGGAVDEKVFKCTTWGSMYECLNYLLRRAAENKDAASRTKDTRIAMGAELMRRLRASVGLVA